MTAPLTDRTPPTRKAVIALGIRIVQKIESFIGSTSAGKGLPVIWLAIIFIRSASEI